MWTSGYLKKLNQNWKLPIFFIEVFTYSLFLNIIIILLINEYLIDPPRLPYRFKKILASQWHFKNAVGSKILPTVVAEVLGTSAGFGYGGPGLV